MKKFYLSLILLIGMQCGISAQIKPSIYVGLGMGTNLGGTIGIGGEVKYKSLSFNAAVGSWVGDYPAHSGDKYRFDYDVGIKLYLKYGLFVGLNYGVIGEAMYTKKDNDNNIYFEKTHGYSYIIGYKRNIFNNIYTSVYLGFTSSKEENHLYLFNRQSFIPRMGILIGYNFL